ncbi:unnamed protein product [Rotaria sp. Silwood2]|nr:unnamed protein product [Rotaria sp. Silwood2]CAF2876094.1 unnamed protein product [Rotaria sp. Silwood2]CAF4265264.1 unnamed protein product [Rotaria sp. Silwood2]CAF4288292.1 unnamed protein product [Rotaria sp. Silwood2]
MKILKGILLKKRSELKKKSIISANINGTTDTSLDNPVIGNVTNITQLSVQEPINIWSPISSNYATEDQLKQHLIDLIDDWCMQLKENENQFAFRLQQDTDYEIMIDLVSNKMLIKCQCSVKTVLGQKSNRYILSNFIRHLTQKKPCAMVQQKLMNINQNTSVNDVSDDNHISDSVDVELTIMSNSVSPVSPLRGKRKRNRSVELSLSKKKKSI